MKRILLSLVSICVCLPLYGQQVLSQFVDGSYPDGSKYVSTLMLSVAVQTRVDPVCTVKLYGLSASLRDQSGRVYTRSNVFTINLPTVSSWTILRSLADQPIDSGYATVQCDQAVNTQLLYALHDRTGTKLAEAAILPATPAATSQFLADEREGVRVGLAIANDSDTLGDYDMFALDQDARLVGATTITLPARTSVARLIDEWMRLPQEFVGPVIVTTRTGSRAPAMTALRITGTVFTTISVFAGVFPPVSLVPVQAPGPTSVLPEPTVTAPVPLVPAQILIVSGNNQGALKGSTLSAPLKIRVVNSAGTPVPNVVVTWISPNGTGVVSTATTTTNSSGEAQVNAAPFAPSSVFRASVSANGVTLEAFFTEVGL